MVHYQGFPLRSRVITSMISTLEHVRGMTGMLMDGDDVQTAFQHKNQIGDGSPVCPRGNLLSEVIEGKLSFSMVLHI